MSRKKFWVTMVGVFMVSVSTSLAAYEWTGNGSDRLWSNSDNWDTAGGPNSSWPWCDVTPNGGGPLINSTVNATFGGQMDLGWNNAGAVTVLDMTGGSLAGGKLGVGTYYYGGTESSVMNLSGGEVTLTTSMLVGSRTRGVLNMTGGTVNAIGGLQISVGAGSNTTQQAASSGDVSLDGGVFTAGYLLMCTSGANLGSGHLDITGGKLVLPDTQVGTVNTYIANGWVTGFGDSSKVVVTPVGSNIEVTAVPEPATLGLLLIGGLVSFLRKKA